MKSRFSIFLFTSFIASISFSQNVSKIKTYDSFSSKGFRVSLVKPTLDAKLVGTYQEKAISGSGRPDSAMGIGVGYAYLPVQKFGWTSSLSMIEGKSSNVSTVFARIEGNLAYAFNSYLNLKGGVNLVKFTSTSMAEDMSIGAGFQGSLGFQLNKNFGIDVGYSEFNSSGKTTLYSNGQSIGKADIDAKFSGLEVVLIGTF